MARGNRGYRAHLKKRIASYRRRRARPRLRNYAWVRSALHKKKDWVGRREFALNYLKLKEVNYA